MQLEKEIADALHANKQHRNRLIGLYPTRFVERHEYLITAATLLPYVINAINKMPEWSQNETRSSAVRLLRSLSNFEFLIALHMLSKVSRLLRPPTRALQEVGIDLSKAMDEVTNVIQVLETYRDDEHFTSIFESAEAMAKSLNVEVCHYLMQADIRSH